MNFLTGKVNRTVVPACLMQSSVKKHMCVFVFFFNHISKCFFDKNVLFVFYPTKHYYSEGFGQKEVKFLWRSVTLCEFLGGKIRPHFDHCTEAGAELRHDSEVPHLPQKYGLAKYFTIKKNFLEHVNPFCGATDTLFWISADVCPDFIWYISHLCVLSPAYNGFSRFTCGATPADFELGM